MTLGLCEYSKNEVEMIKAISPHWADVISKVSIAPMSLYKALVIECFCNNRVGPEVEALRRAMVAIEGCKIYRMTPEFDSLLEF